MLWVIAAFVGAGLLLRPAAAHARFVPPARVERWRPYVRKHLPGVPEDFVLAWISRESGGYPAGRPGRPRETSLRERGLFQIHPDEAKGMRLTNYEFDSLLVREGERGYSADEHFEISSRFVRYKEKTAQGYMTKLGFTFDGRDYWTYVKLTHGLPTAAKYGAAAFIEAHGRGPRSFAELASWIRETRWTYGAFSARRVSQIVANAEDTGRYA